MFRAGRPGYQPWYITEEEGRLLALCLATVLEFCDFIQTHPPIQYWSKEDTYPLVTLVPGKRHEQTCEVSLAAAQWSPLTALAPVNYDKDRVARILGRGHPVVGIMEVDHFFGGAPIGGKSERKACVRAAIATDARSGFAFPPVLGEPSDAKGDLLVRVVLEAIESANFVPQEIRVNGADSAMALGALTNALGISVQVVETLPSLDEFKRQMLRMMGDSGLSLDRDE